VEGFHGRKLATSERFPKGLVARRRFFLLPNRDMAGVIQGGIRRINAPQSSGANLEALMQALDPDAPGPVPYTVVIAPGGKIIYRHAGIVDAAELRAQLIDTLGTYYPSPTR